MFAGRSENRSMPEVLHTRRRCVSVVSVDVCMYDMLIWIIFVPCELILAFVESNNPFTYLLT